jgi:energy-coupling factor transporter ATP-binding protein EcfA2
MGTYVYQTFESYPYLGFTGMQGSGKSKILRILAFLCFNGQQVVNISEASLFRDVESLRSTIIIDEGEFLNDKKNKEAMFALLNSGYSRGPGVPRQVKDSKNDMFTQYFQIYSPKAIANIAGFESVLNSRIINIPMMRASGERGSLSPTDNSEDWPLFRHWLYAHALCFFKDIQRAHSSDPGTRINNNRSNDLWSPLLSVARIIFQKRAEEFEHFKSFAQKEIVRSCRNSLDEQTKTLLVALRDLVTKDGFYEVQNIRNRVAFYFTGPIVEEINPEWVGYRLRNFGFERKRRTSKGMIYHFTVEQVKDVLERYRNEISEDPIDEEANANTGHSQKMPGVPGQPVLFDSRL